MAQTAFDRFTSCVPRNCPARESSSFKHLAGQVRMDLEPGRIGFMSTQRRENHWQRRSCTQSAGASRHGNSAPIARRDRAHARVGTAPPATPAWFHPSDGDLSLGARERLATNSLQSDCRTIQLVQCVQSVPLSVVPSVPRGKLCKSHKARSAPPSGAALGAAAGTLATLRSSPSFIPSPSGLVCLHPTSPRFPAGKRRWTERYDGKGNLHLLHAA